MSYLYPLVREGINLSSTEELYILKINHQKGDNEENNKKLLVALARAEKYMIGLEINFRLAWETHDEYKLRNGLWFGYSYTFSKYLSILTIPRPVEWLKVCRVIATNISITVLRLGDFTGYHFSQEMLANLLNEYIKNDACWLKMITITREFIEVSSKGVLFLLAKLLSAPSVISINFNLARVYMGAGIEDDTILLLNLALLLRFPIRNNVNITEFQTSMNLTRISESSQYPRNARAATWISTFFNTKRPRKYGVVKGS